MSEKRYTVGELAKISGATVRTIQYYDRIELLSAQRAGEKNTRYYTKNDLMTLQQILFFKRIGLPLKEIKKQIKQFGDAADLKKILNKQANLLLQQEMEIKMNQTIIKVILDSIETNPNQSLEPIIKLVLGLNKQTILEYANVEFNRQTREIFEHQYNDDDYKDIIEFYWQWKALILEAATYKLNNVSYKTETAYQLGRKWNDFIKRSTGEDPEILKAYENGQKQSDQWPEEDLFLYNFSKNFIENAHSYYLEKAAKRNLMKKGDEFD